MTPRLGWLALGQLLLTGLVGWLHLRLASDEPFVTVARAQAWTFVWLPGVLAAAQLFLAIAVTRAALRGRRPLAFAFLAWSVVVLLALATIPGPYIDDVVKFQGWKPPAG